MASSDSPTDMSTDEYPIDSADSTRLDVGAIWKDAIDRYENTTGTKFESLVPANNANDVLKEIRERERKFEHRRHDGSKTDRFRTLVNRSLVPFDRICQVLQPVLSSFEPSAAIFTAMRFLIDTVNAVSADYDKIAGFFEDLDLYLQRLQILERRVMSIPELKSSLVKVLASALDLCGICAKYIKMNRIAKSFRNMGSGEDPELTSAYAHFHKMVEHNQGVVRNATLANVDQLRKETNYNSKKLAEGTERVQRHLESREAIRERDEIVKGLSSLSFHDKQRDLFGKHQEGTGKWVLQTDKFQQWFVGQENSTLWCYGMPGGGKTIMTLIRRLRSIAINYTSEFAKETSAIAYLFCDYKDPETKSEIDLLSSIARQLAEQTKEIPAEVKDFRDKNAEKRRNPTRDEWTSLVRSLCCLFPTTYIFVDALDECPEKNRDNLLCMLKSLEPYARFLFTSRPHGDLPVEFDNSARIEISASESDIEAYLELEIEGSSRLSKFIAKDPKLKVDIIKGISGKAMGMFLLAHLQMNSLCRQNNIRQVRKGLSELPAGIYATYDDALKRIESSGNEDCELVKRALSYIFCARRPLNAEELCHALAVEPEDSELDETAIPETAILLNASGGLVRIDENSGIIRLVHHTLHEYFEANSERLAPNPDSEIARVCLTYLSFDIFGAGPCSDGETLTQRLAEYRLLDYASRYWGDHVMRSQLPELTEVITAFLEDSQKLSTSIQASYMTSYRKKDWYDRFPKQFGPLHVASYWGLGNILTVFLESDVDVDAQDSYGMTALHLAADNGRREAVQILLSRGPTVNTQSQNGETALHCAARNGHEEIVNLLLLNGADIIADDHGWTALNWAVLGGDIEVVKALLHHGAGLENGNDGINDALFLAAEEGREVMVQMLLDNGARVDAKDAAGSTAFDFAVAVGHEPTIRVLLQNGEKVNSRDIYGNSPLHWAVTKDAVVILLLESGADIHAKNDSGQTALCWTAQDGSVAVAQRLLDKNADVNARDGDGVTPLHRAALRGSEDMVRLLLKNGANPGARDDDSWTPLHAAAVNRHEGVAQMLSETVENGKEILDWVALEQQDLKKGADLAKSADMKGQGSTVLSGLRVAAQEAQIGRLQMMLEKGADINAKDAGGWTALELGAFQGHEDVVRLLLEMGADIEIRGSLEYPPLCHAIDQRNENVVPLLIEHGADVNVTTYGSTPLMLAVERGSQAIAQLLIDGGADVDARDYEKQSALHIASLEGRGDLVQLLIDKGADVNATDDQGRTALILAVENVRYAAAELLLESGAGTEAKTRDGSTALHIATTLGNETMVQLLLSWGVDAEAKTGDNSTASQIAGIKGFEGIVTLLSGETTPCREKGSTAELN